MNYENVRGPFHGIAHPYGRLWIQGADESKIRGSAFDCDWWRLSQRFSEMPHDWEVDSRSTVIAGEAIPIPKNWCVDGF